MTSSTRICGTRQWLVGLCCCYMLYCCQYNTIAPTRTTSEGRDVQFVAQLVIQACNRFPWHSHRIVGPLLSLCWRGTFFSIRTQKKCVNCPKYDHHTSNDCHSHAELVAAANRQMQAFCKLHRVGVIMCRNEYDCSTPSPSSKPSINNTYLFFILSHHFSRCCWQEGCLFTIYKVRLLVGLRLLGLYY